MGWSDDAARNRELWTRINSEYTAEQAARKWALDEIRWGIWDVPDSELDLLGDVSGLDVAELGCGTAYVSAVLAKQGAQPVGVDITPAQLETARACMAATGIEFPLIEADAGASGLEAESFDLVISEYGGSIWVDPDRFYAESARLLRPGGRLVFLCGSILQWLCTTEDEKVVESLVRDQFGMRRIEWEGEGVEFMVPHGIRFDLLGAHGFRVERLVEVQAPATAETHPYYGYVSAEWARKWPSEEIWAARKQ